jgi:hypothetical protein
MMENVRLEPKPPRFGGLGFKKWNDPFERLLETPYIGGQSIRVNQSGC